jgi:glutamate dehydrogenase (NAD(P)+)
MVDFDLIGKYERIPAQARRILEVAEKEVTLAINLRLNKKKAVFAPAYLVFYNTVRGPAKGGIRFASDVTLASTRDLAQRMLWKTALTKIPFGGGKSSVAIDPYSLATEERTAVMKEFVHLIREDLRAGNYIPAPDLGTNEADMAVIYGETHILESVTGKPARVGGLPGRKQATGHGVATATLLAMEHRGLDRKKCTVAIQGFGNVGSWAAHFLCKAGLNIVAVSEVTGGVYDKGGLDIAKMMKYSGTGLIPKKFKSLRRISNEELLRLNVDILIPAAVGNILTERNASKIRAKMIVEGANGPTTEQADRIFDKRGIFVVPDILANSGGVIASYLEWRKAKSGSLTKEAETYQTIDELIGESFEEMMRVAGKKKVPPRLGAEIIAVSEVVRTMDDRRWL